MREVVGSSPTATTIFQQFAFSKNSPMRYGRLAPRAWISTGLVLRRAIFVYASLRRSLQAVLLTNLWIINFYSGRHDMSREPAHLRYQSAH
jgi:hypothetical protein